MLTHTAFILPSFLNTINTNEKVIKYYAKQTYVQGIK
jgi:hypothetical protein